MADECQAMAYTSCNQFSRFRPRSPGGSTRSTLTCARGAHWSSVLVAAAVEYPAVSRARTHVSDLPRQVPLTAITGAKTAPGEVIGQRTTTRKR